MAKCSRMAAFVTGAAGFIGSTLVDRLLVDGHEVIGYDNFSTGQDLFIADACRAQDFRLIRGDTLDQRHLTEAMSGASIVFHLAANADVRFGTTHPAKDLEQNTIATFNVLEAMRVNSVSRIVFASTASIYGDTDVIPTPEDVAFPVQTSLYAASKLACEGLIEAFCEGFGMQAWIYRLVSILGERYAHGHIFDFYRSLRVDPTRLRVLGDGGQRKSYLYVQDCVDGMLLPLEHSEARVNIFNLGTDGYCSLRESIGWICEYLGVRPVLEYAGGERGWVGDNPFIFLDTTRIRRLGWHPRLTIEDGVVRTLQYLERHQNLLERRP